MDIMVEIQIVKTQDGYEFTVVSNPQGVLLNGVNGCVLVPNEMATTLWDGERLNPNAVRDFVASLFGLQDKVSCRFVDEYGREIQRVEFS